MRKIIDFLKYFAVGLLTVSIGGIFVVNLLKVENNIENLVIGGNVYNVINQDKNLLEEKTSDPQPVSIDLPVVEISVDESVEPEPEIVPVILVSTDEVSEDKPEPETVPILPVSTDVVIVAVSEDKPVPQHQEEIPKDRTETLKGYLKTRYDKSTQSFTLNYPSIVDVAFNHSEGDKASYSLTIRDAFDNVIARKIVDSETLFPNTGKLYLRVGTYKAEVERGYSWSGKPYTLTVNISHIDSITEQESNNNLHTANAIPLNENVFASTGHRNDVDYFKFTLDKAYSVYPHLEFAPVRIKRRVYDLKLYELSVKDTKTGETRTFIFKGNGEPSSKIKPFILEAGTYMIAISRKEDTERLELGLHEYTLRVEAREF